MSEGILITGAARSGTSMTAGIVHHCGAFGGATSGPTRWNAKGMFENEFIRDEIVKPYLFCNGWDPLGQNPLPDVTKVGKEQHPLVGLSEQVLNQLKAEGHDGKAWYYKGAKIALIWPLWVQAFPEARWVIVRRSREAIIQSCLRTGFMRAYKDEQGWGKWVDHHLWLFEQMREALGGRVFEFWPTEVINGNMLHAQEMVSFLELPWSNLVDGFIERRLWHD